jgi:hypothetical protein
MSPLFPRRVHCMAPSKLMGRYALVAGFLRTDGRILKKEDAASRLYRQSLAWRSGGMRLRRSLVLNTTCTRTLTHLWAIRCRPFGTRDGFGPAYPAVTCRAFACGLPPRATPARQTPARRGPRCGAGLSSTPSIRNTPRACMSSFWLPQGCAVDRELKNGRVGKQGAEIPCRGGKLVNKRGARSPAPQSASSAFIRGY